MNYVGMLMCLASNSGNMFCKTQTIVYRLQMAQPSAFVSTNNSEPNCQHKSFASLPSPVRLIDHVVGRRASLSTAFIDPRRSRIVTDRSLQLSSSELLPL